MKTNRVHIFRDSPTAGMHSVSASVSVPGLGDLDLTSCLSHETCERIYAEVEEFTRNKFKMLPAVQPIQGETK